MRRRWGQTDLNDYYTYRQKKVSPYESSDSLLSYTELPSWLHGASLLSDIDLSFRWQEAKDSTEAGISLLWSSQTTCGRNRVRMCEVIFFLFFCSLSWSVCAVQTSACFWMNHLCSCALPFFALQSVFGRLVVKCRKDNKSKPAPTNIWNFQVHKQTPCTRHAHTPLDFLNL